MQKQIQTVRSIAGDLDLLTPNLRGLVFRITADKYANSVKMCHYFYDRVASLTPC